MTITFDPQTEARLQAIAAKTHVPIEALIKRIVESELRGVNQGDAVVEAPKERSWLDLGAPIRGLFTTDELDTVFSRSRSLSRSVDLA